MTDRERGFWLRVLEHLTEGPTPHMAVGEAWSSVPTYGDSDLHEAARIEYALCHLYSSANATAQDVQDLRARVAEMLWSEGG